MHKQLLWIIKELIRPYFTAWPIQKYSAWREQLDRHILLYWQVALTFLKTRLGIHSLVFWENRSQSLFCKGQQEQFAHSRSFLKNERANCSGRSLKKSDWVKIDVSDSLFCCVSFSVILNKGEKQWKTVKNIIKI